MTSLDDVYRKFGETAEAAQLLETELGTILLVINASESDLFTCKRPEEAAQILRRVNKSTLGHVLKKIGEKTGEFDNAAGLFAGAVAERNRLVHTFFRQHNFRRNSSEGCAVMLADLESIHATLLEAYKMALAVSGFDIDSVRLDIVPTKHVKLQ